MKPSDIVTLGSVGRSLGITRYAATRLHQRGVLGEADRPVTYADVQFYAASEQVPADLRRLEPLKPQRTKQEDQLPPGYRSRLIRQLQRQGVALDLEVLEGRDQTDLELLNQLLEKLE